MLEDVRYDSAIQARGEEVVSRLIGEMCKRLCVNKIIYLYTKHDPRDHT